MAQKFNGNILAEMFPLGSNGLKTVGHVLQVTVNRGPWYVDGQVAGFVKQFDLMDLVTVKGSGHMVPEDKPAPALHMIRAFILGTPY